MPLARWLALLAGFWVLYHYSLVAFGGRSELWLFEKFDPSRATAMAMLTGTLRLRNRLTQLGHDEQVYNGAVYTNWGYGVPLLQVPFHAAAARLMSQKFFPDRAIYFAYFTAMIPVLWAGFDRLLAMREGSGASKMRRHLLSWAATAFVLTTVFYPLMCSRFVVYEETVCYFAMVEFLALAAYVFALRSWSAWAIAGLGIAAGLGVLVRPTGLLYLGMWALLLLLEHRTRRTLLTFAAATAPFVAFWLVSNWVRTGSVVGLGLGNAVPFYPYHTEMQRFGNTCSDSPAHAWQVAGRLFRAFFARQEDLKDWWWLRTCHFTFEARPVPGRGGAWQEPVFGVGVLVALVVMLAHQLRRRESRLAFYLPTAVLVALFGAYVWAGAGFAWRYAEDFWPAIVLAVVQYVRFLPSASVSRLGMPLAIALVGCSWAAFEENVPPNLGTQLTLDDREAATMWNDFLAFRWGEDKRMPSEIKCADQFQEIWHNMQGWEYKCGVDTFTNVFVGVPSKTEETYKLAFKTTGFEMPTLRVYVNGRLYTAHRTRDGYVADVTIRYDRLTAPIVMTTIEWTPDRDALPGKLLAIKLT